MIRRRPCIRWPEDGTDAGVQGRCPEYSAISVARYAVATGKVTRNVQSRP